MLADARTAANTMWSTNNDHIKEGKKQGSVAADDTVLAVLGDNHQRWQGSELRTREG